MPAADELSVRAEPVRADGLDRIAPAWAELQRRSGEDHYGLSAGWLAAWARTAAPGRLCLLRVEDSSGGDVALGLAESRGAGRWSFAGGAVTPHRRLLCAPGAQTGAWLALWGWLARRPDGWHELEASGVPGDAPLPSMSRRYEQVEFSLALPGSFDEYLAARSPGTRKGLKGKLRRLEREGATVEPVAPGEQRALLAEFVRLHGSRAAAKGERHEHVDARLTELLGALPDGPEPVLRMFVLRAGAEVSGVSVRLDAGETAYFYNSGIDPARADLSPGVCLELASIRDAIERGLRRFDLGPGDWRYKRDLGGQPSHRLRVIAAAPTLRGRALGLARALRG